MARDESQVAVTSTALEAPGLLRRRIADRAAWALGFLALACICAPAIWIVVGVVVKAVPGWRWSVLTTSGVAVTKTLPRGGLESEILGTLIIMAGVMILAGAVGVLSGLYLAEHAPAKQGSLLRGASEVLAGVPSIVLGYVGYTALVVGLQWHYSLAAGVVVLSLFVTPYIAKSTESALRQVPTSYREGAQALGMSESYALRKVVLRSAIPGITTGLIVALALSVGETAPLLYTAGSNDALPTLQLTHHGIGYLTYAVWTFFNLPYKASVQLSYDAALLLIVMVLFLLVVAHLVVNVSQRYSESSTARSVRRRRGSRSGGAGPSGSPV